jgi:hypothetical protein
VQLPDPPSSFSIVELARSSSLRSVRRLFPSGVSNRRSQAMPALPATSASQVDKSARTAAASIAARVRFAEIT